MLCIHNITHINYLYFLILNRSHQHYVVGLCYKPFLPFLETASDLMRESLLAGLNWSSGAAGSGLGVHRPTEHVHVKEWLAIGFVDKSWCLQFNLAVPLSSIPTYCVIKIIMVISHILWHFIDKTIGRETKNIIWKPRGSIHFFK